MSVNLVKKGVALLLVFAPIVHATEWSAIGSENSNGTRFYVDNESIREDGRFKRVWVMEDRVEKYTVVEQKKKISYLSYITLQLFDCENEKKAIVEGRFYSERKGQGVVLASFSDKPKEVLLKQAQPNTWASALIDHVCNGAKKIKIQT